MSHDLTLEPMAMCASWERFEIKVKGSKGAEYIVSHGKQSVDSDFVYGFLCNCPAFKYRNNCGYECKHIKSIKERVCLWHQQFNGGAAVDGVCPRCGNDVIGIMCAV